MDAPKARPVEAHAYLGPDEPDSPRSLGQRARRWLGWILVVAIGLAAAKFNVTSWLIAAWALAVLGAVLVDQYKRHVRRQSKIEI